MPKENKDNAVQEEVQENQFRVKLNPDTGLRGYSFEDGLDVLDGQKPWVTESQYKEYAKEKHNGHQVLLKA